MRTAVLLLVLLLPGRAAALQQAGFAPGPGWTSAGPAALLDPDLPPWGGIPAPGRGAWLSVFRPWGVTGLQQEEGALQAGTWALTWREVSGGGLNLRYAEGAAVIRAGPAWLLLGAGTFRLSGGGLAPRDRSALRTGIRAGPADGSRAVLTIHLPVSRARGVRPAWYFAAGHRAGPCRLGAGTGAGPAGGEGLTLSLDREAARIGWTLSVVGPDAVPAAGLRFRSGRLLFRVDGRWVPGPGLHLVTSVLIRGRP